ncbi:hypothetical protein HPULCUR_010652 [Helicostylum pulchrum]|uniref:Uncharacterized protein n=1 Tax=Helicostylum pulchrum TaxID=562976 RepID=A0ABP9YDW0_9FUNG
MFDDDYSIELPIYTLRCRNVIVADLPDAPLFYASNQNFTCVLFVFVPAYFQQAVEYEQLVKYTDVYVLIFTDIFYTRNRFVLDIRLSNALA